MFLLRRFTASVSKNVETYQQNIAPAEWKNWYTGYYYVDLFLCKLYYTFVSFNLIDNMMIQLRHDIKMPHL